MKEVEFDIKEWLQLSESNEWVLNTLRLWFSFQTEFQNETWCRYPDIYDDKKFWAGCQPVLLSHIGNFSDYIESTSIVFDFSDETIARVSKIVELLGGIEGVDPHADENDNSIGAFLMFVLKDACEYSGLNPKRKDIPERRFRNAMFVFNKLSAQSEALTEVIDALDSE